jgi:hypothetical protein
VRQLLRTHSQLVQNSTLLFCLSFH